MITILLLITVIAGSWWIIYLTFVAVIKQSKIYYGLFNRIKKSNSLKDDAVEEIQKKMMRFSVKKIVGIKKIHQSYVFEEIGILLVIAIIKSEEKEWMNFIKE